MERVEILSGIAVLLFFIVGAISTHIENRISRKVLTPTKDIVSSSLSSFTVSANNEVGNARRRAEKQGAFVKVIGE